MTDAHFWYLMAFDIPFYHHIILKKRLFVGTKLKCKMPTIGYQQKNNGLLLLID